ncbi:MAG: hypothetical protein WD928_10115 [Gammaproteobacteria bacterium]
MPFILELELQGSKLRGHDRFWEIIGEIGRGGEPFTVLDIVGRTNAHKATVVDFVKRLVRGELLAEAGWRGEGRFRQRAYRLVKWQGQTPSLRRDGTRGAYGRGRQQMWNVLRSPHAVKGIAADDLAMLAATDDVAVGIGSAKEFLLVLEKAGYLRVLQKAANNRLTRYQLRPAMNSGPLAPKLLKTRLVYDQNRRAVVGTAVAEEVPS